MQRQQTVTQSWANMISLAQRIGGTKAGKTLAKKIVLEGS